MAVTNRMISYGRGLVEAGHKVEILLPKPTERSPGILNREAKGNYSGIEYHYTSGTSVVPEGFIRRVWKNGAGYFNALKIIRGIDGQAADLMIMVGPQGFLRTFGYWILSRIKGISYWQERSEYPFLTNKPGPVFRLNLFIYLHLTCRMFDGMILITKALKEYFHKHLRKSAGSYILPMLVEVERFALATEMKPGFPYIAYCGSMEGEKDGVQDLVTAFSLIASDFPDVRLVLIGNSEFAGSEHLKNQISKTGLDHRIIFTGRIERDALPGWLKGAQALVLARPNNKQAEGGFPTKLGEYLATGRPVVVTRTGEIPEFLTHLKDAFLAEPGHPEDVAEKLGMLLSDTDAAKTVGMEGFETAKRCFGYKEQTKKMGDYFLRASQE
jgi:glycosyltransferase involved in cell wall biosynthesis